MEALSLSGEGETASAVHPTSFTTYLLHASVAPNKAGGDGKLEEKIQIRGDRIDDSVGPSDPIQETKLNGSHHQQLTSVFLDGDSAGSTTNQASASSRC